MLNPVNTLKNKYQVSKQYKNEKLLAWLSLMILTTIFSILLFNKYFPITEGWLHDYSRYMDDGDFIYRDFYCPMAPGSVWVTFLICKITNYSFLAMRIFGIIERLCLLTIIFHLVSKVFNYKVCVIGVFTGSVIYASTIADLFYGYYQSALLFSVISLHFCIKMYENFDNNLYKYSILFGLFAGITFCFRQNTGALFPAMIGICYIILTFKRGIKKSILSIAYAFFTAMGVIALLLIYLALNGAFIPFFEQVFGGSSAKGSLISIFTSFIPRMINSNSIRLLIYCIITFILFVICSNVKKNTNYNKANKKIILNGAGVLMIISSTVLLYQYLLEPFHLLDWILSMQITKYLFFFLLIASVIAFCAFLYNNYKTESFQLDSLFYLGLILFLSFCFTYISFHQNISTDYNLLRTHRAYLIYALFFFNVIYIIYLLYKYFQGKEHGIKIILYFACFSFMYIHGMSYIVEDHGTLLLFSMIISDLLTHKLPFNTVKNILVYFLCIGTVLTIDVQRNNLTYEWWGVNALPTSYTAHYSYKDPHLKGILGEETQVNVMNQIYDTIQNNKKNDDTLYTFPHINYFNVMSDLDSPTFAKVHYFDVCADEQASKDAKILKESLPTFIIWQEFREEEWATHEAIFRGGERCGQRDIQNVYKELTENGSYTLLGSYVINNSDPIYIWGLNDGRTWK